MSLSLSDEINAAIKPLHTDLNRLILHLLPLALPPQTPTPHLYAYGIAQFLPVYSAFEAPLRYLHSLAHSRQLIPTVQRLHIPALERSSILEHDLKYLPPWRSPSGSRLEDTIAGSNVNADALPRLEKFVTHISAAVAAKPHMLVAYTWIFYMALFSGGRYIRAKLRSVEGKGFWVQEYNPIPAGGPVKDVIPLGFWDFPAATHDGEDLKVEFKARVQDIESGLNQKEREDIIQEAVEIMTQLLGVVREIDSSIRERDTHQGEKLSVPFTISTNTTPQNAQKTPSKDEEVPLVKPVLISRNTVVEAFNRIRDIFSFSPGPVTVAVQLRETVR